MTHRATAPTTRWGPFPYAGQVKPLAYRLPSGHMVTVRGRILVARTKKQRKLIRKRYPAWTAVPFKTITVSAWEAGADAR